MPQVLNQHYAPEGFTYIYGLIDPRTNQCRYIGKTDDLKYRLRMHLGEKSRTKKTGWIKGLLKSGNKPSIEIFEVAAVEDWEEAERFWIAYGKFLGCNLTNGTLGGDGGLQTPDVRAKMSLLKKGVGAGIKRGPHPPERRANISMALKGKIRGPYPPERGIKISAAVKGKTRKPLSEEHRQKISDALKGKSHSQEHNERVSQALTGVKRGPLSEKQKEFLREKFTGRIFSEESLKKMSESQLKAHARRRALKEQRANS